MSDIFDDLMGVTFGEINAQHRAREQRAARRGFSEDQARDEFGRWTAGGGGVGGRIEPTLTGRGTKEDPVRGFTSVNAALEALKDGLHVEMDPHMLSISLDRMAEIAREAKERGEKAPTYDLCQISVPDTNLFCNDAVVETRDEMPQLATENPVPGSIADGMPRNEYGWVDAAALMKERLVSEGHAVTQERVPAAELKAAQNDLDGAKVASIMQTLQSGGNPAGEVFVSSDNYIIDGHHRWAAGVGVDYDDDKALGGVSMDVVRVDMPIMDILDYANAFAAEIGIPSAGIAAAILGYSEDQPRDESGKFGTGGGSDVYSLGYHEPKGDATLRQVEADLKASFPGAEIVTNLDGNAINDPDVQLVLDGFSAAAIELSEEFPEVAARVDEVHLGIPEKWIGQLDPDSHMGAYNDDYRALVLNPGLTSQEPARVTEDQLGGQRSLYPEAGPEYIGAAVVFHEFGHIIDHAISGGTWGESNFVPGDDHISTYAIQAPREYFAEAFAATRIGQDELLNDRDREMVATAEERARSLESSRAAAAEERDGWIIDDFEGSVIWLADPAAMTAAMLAYYGEDPNERDEAGKFATGGGGGGGGGGQPPAGVTMDVAAFEAAHPKLPGEDQFAYQGRIAHEILDPQQRSEYIFAVREVYEPVAALVDGAARWNEEQGLPPIPDGIIDMRADLAEADEVARYFESTPDMANDPEVQAAYDDFKDQNAEMYDYMTRPESEGGLGITVSYTNEPDPYPSAEAQAQDLRENNHITIETGLGGSHGATMTTEEYDQFRAVHDVFGHAAVGAGFDRHGEYEAWLMHAAMYEEPGRQAMSTEYHAVNSAMWSGTPDPGGTGKSVLLPGELADPPWERTTLVAAAGDEHYELTAEDYVAIEALGLDAEWANHYEPWPWHFDEEPQFPEGDARQAALGAWLADFQEDLHPRDERGRWGEKGDGGVATLERPDDRPTFAGSVVEPVRALADGKAGYNAEHGLDPPSDRDWASVMADPELGAQIAADYEEMSAYDETAEPSYDALAAEVDAQFDYLTETLGIEVEFMDRDPYDNVEQLVADLRDNNHIGVLSTDATPPGHPYLSNEVNDQFRAVHDAFGHAAIGRGFDRNGEEAAFQSHAEMFTPTATAALASETRGQNSALNYGGYGARGEFPPQKFDLLPEDDLVIDEYRTTRASMQAAPEGNADDDNLYAVTGSHHVSMGRSFRKPPLPERPAPAHTSLGRYPATTTASVTGSTVSATYSGTLPRVANHECSCQKPAAPRVAAYTTAPLDEPFPVPAYPPRSWFEKPAWLAAGQKITVTDDGQVAGYWYPAGHCLVHSHGDCPASSLTGYAAFHQQDVVTDDGETIRVGAIGNTHGHADPHASIGSAARHYADPSAQLMVVRSGDDEHGGWIAGALVPGVTYGDVALIRRSGLSGDWRQFPNQWFEAHGIDRREVQRVESFDAIGPTLVTRPGLPLVERFGSVMLGGMAGIQLSEGAPMDTTPTRPARRRYRSAAPPPPPGAGAPPEAQPAGDVETRLAALEAAMTEVVDWINSQREAQVAALSAAVVPLPETDGFVPGPIRNSRELADAVAAGQAWLDEHTAVGASS